MKKTMLYVGLFSAFSLNTQLANAHTATLFYDYVATNSDTGGGGYISKGTGGAYAYAATLTITDLSDLGISGGTSFDGSQIYSNGGVRITLNNLHSTDIFGTSSSAATALGSFELNFPNTAASSTDFTSNYVNWGDNTGVKLAYNKTNSNNGGIEWQEGGCISAANSGGCTTAANSTRAEWNGWGQQFNYGGNNGTNIDNTGAVVAVTQGTSSTIDLFNGASTTNISVQNLLGNAIAASGNNSVNLPIALSWLNAITGLPNSTDPNNRAVAATGWWGTSINGTSTSNTSNRINLLATHYSLDSGTIQAASATVPLPSAFWFFLSGMMGLFAYNRRKS